MEEISFCTTNFELSCLRDREEKKMFTARVVITLLVLLILTIVFH